MFPDYDLDTVVSQINSATSSKGLGKVFYMVFEDGKLKIVLENGSPKECSTDKEKVLMYLHILLRTCVGKYKVYEDTDFGTTIEKYIGNKTLPRSFMLSEFKRELSEQLDKLQIVDSITEINFTKDRTNLKVEFAIYLENSQLIKVSEVI